MRKLLLFTLIFLTTISVVFHLNKERSSSNREPSLKNEYEDQFTHWWNNKKEAKRNGASKADKPEEFLNYYNSIRTKYGDNGPKYGVNYLLEESEKLGSQNFIKNKLLVFDERGPANVPGRTRGLIVDPRDATGNTWFAGSVGGGIWKTTDAGTTWENKTPELPNIAISWLVMAPSDNQILYAGTGEGFSASAGFIKGAGVFKSIDGGETWNQLQSTANENFQTISRIIVDPENPDVVLVCANNDPLNADTFNSGIFKTTDGGDSWSRVYDAQRSYVQDLDYEPGNFSVIYAAERRFGVLKSTDAGETWESANTGMQPSGRVEITVSPVKTDRLFASAEGGQTGNGSDLYISDDGAQTWNLLLESSKSDNIENNVDFLGGQGWYDNIVMPHPFDKDIVYVGGVNLWKFSISDGDIETTPTVQGTNTEGETLFQLVQFGGEYENGTIGSGTAEIADISSVEVRFGPGLSQMAHRFTVPEGRGAGVAAGDYTYQDYVEVPFEVWDTDNNRQLMVSFRDQQKDGEFNLINLNTAEGEEENHSREYIYIHTTDYKTTADSSIAVDGGQEASNSYFIWPYLDGSASWNPDNLPSTVFSINWGSLSGRIKDTYVVADAYGQFTGVNSFSQTTGATTVTGVHPDHHNLVPIITDETFKEFKILNASDGGIYVTNSGKDPGVTDGDWNYSGNGYNTTQFYFVDKAPGEDRYVGGTQDNGTWLTPPYEESDETTKYKRALGGDGFGVVWHYTDPSKILGSVYYNSINKSENGGASFQSATEGLSDVGAGSAPFITRLENSNSQPDVVYAVGASGVWKSSDFADSWSSVYQGDDWRMTTFAQVKISEATPMVVYAGAGMVEGITNLIVSKDNGNSFEPVNNYTEVEMGLISGLGTHPNDPAQAFALFSFAKSPKVLHTTDYGQTWKDISGFGTSEVSSNGFPDVAVFDLQVMPFDNNIIWVGTEIGIVESTDGGETWHKLNSSLPAASVWDIKIEDDQIVMATHGRGIWSITIPELPETILAPQLKDIGFSLSLDPIFDIESRTDFDSVGILIEGYDSLFTDGLPSGVTSVLVDLAGEENEISFSFVGYKNGLAFPGKNYIQTIGSWPEPVNEYVNYFTSSTEDFGTKDIKQTSSSAFKGRPYQTPHNYKADTEYELLLEIPIRVSQSNAFISYKDVAIVEPTLNEDNSLKDYVVVEASNDGFNWIPLENPYNASYDETWLELYNNGSNPDESHFKEHYIELDQFFEAGEIILVRFRMISDSETTGWGWVVDDLIIQSRNSYLSIEDDLIDKVTLYPTILSNGNRININTKQDLDSYSIFRLSGQEVQAGKLNSDNSITLTNCYSKGIYIVRLFDPSGNATVSRKIIVN
ncbi:VPS10 domain-containing protein [Mangrovivirga cuniculi]|uniref:Sortilin N-terminal domain-containing protein n=1 Tax=Mangrovivirga cuniculi TaxID=2715131 RepID=A0A4D7JT60_9BACT|nr:T9SS type A sorting domain-containing protein [Mangrovivirga cuniculi]QCK14115.1 hypothetical protein DCC35_04795 [Mangrovivirga cuniculi]